MKSCLLWLILTIAMASAASAAPQTRDGFFLRLSGGFGLGEDWKRSDPSNGAQSLRGPAYVGDIAIGKMLSANLALHATFYSGSMFNPKYEGSGDSTAVEADETYIIRSGGAGVGFTYYFMPANVYVGASGGFGNRSTERTRADENTTTTTITNGDMGVSAQAILGKEWWVSDEWSLGLAGLFILVDVPTKIDDCSACYQTRRTWFSSLVFSATYN